MVNMFEPDNINMENSLFYPAIFNYFEKEQEIDSDLKQPYFKTHNYNNLVCGLSTNATRNENGNKKNKDEMNQFIADEAYFNNHINKDKNEKKKKSLLGRKRKGYSGKSSHSRYSDDNLRRKSKHLVLDNIFKLLNEKIEEKYNGNIGHGIFVKKLFVINQKQISDASIQSNKDFLNKPLGEIFSVDISSKYTIYNPNHNKLLIKELTNEEDEDKKNYFKKLFSITFVDCLRHFRGTQKKEELEGMKGFNDIKSKYEDGTDYLKSLEYYIMNYEEILNKRRIRKSNKKKFKKLINVKKNNGNGKAFQDILNNS